MHPVVVDRPRNPRLQMPRPPSLSEDRIAAVHGWTLECEEVNATVLHSLPFTFTLGGVTPHALSMLDFQQQIEPLVGGNIVRMGSGTGEKREHWRKNRITLAGGGWVPLNGLDGLTYSGSLTLTISRLNTIDGDGNPIVNDPAADSDDQVQRMYLRSELEPLWLENSGGTVYLIKP